MLDYDEMNRELSERERELALEEAQRAREREFFEPEPPDNEDDGQYEIGKAMIEMAQTTLQRRIETARLDYDAVPKAEKSLRQDTLILVVLFCLHLGGYPLILGIISSLMDGSGPMDYAGTFFTTLWLIATVLFLKRLFDGLTHYSVMQSTSRSVPFIEAKEILTLEKMRDYAITRMNYAKERLQKLAVLDKKLERQRFLDEEDLGEVRRLGLPYEVRCIYDPHKTKFFEYLWFLIRGNRM